MKYQIAVANCPLRLKLSMDTAKMLVRLGLKTAAVLRLLKDFFKPEVLILRPG
jgi:hypothetical protein